MKIERKLFATYLEAQIDTPVYELLGVDLEEFTIDMNANIVKTANILGQTSVGIDKYEKQSSVEPYKADTSTPLFEWLKDIVDNDKVLDDLKSNVVHVDLYATETAGAYPAIKEECLVEVVSFGGNTEGVQIPFNIHYTGIKQKGTFNPTTKEFTPSV